EVVVARERREPRVGLADHTGARRRRAHDRLRVAECAHEPARERRGLELIPRVPVHLTAACLLGREVDLDAEALEDRDRRAADAREERVVEAGDEEGGAHRGYGAGPYRPPPDRPRSGILVRHDFRKRLQQICCERRNLAYRRPAERVGGRLEIPREEVACSPWLPIRSISTQSETRSSRAPSSRRCRSSPCSCCSAGSNGRPSGSAWLRCSAR